MSNFEFVNALPAQAHPSRGQYCDRWLIDQFAKDLKARSGWWGKWPAEISPNTAAAYRASIRKRTLRGFRDEQYDAQVRNRTLYVRHIGGAQ